MKSSKYGGRVAILTVAAMLIVVYSLQLHWYRTSDPWGSGADDFVINMNSVDREPAGYESTFFDSVIVFMKWISNFMVLWFVLAFVFLGSIFIDDKNLSLVAGIGSAVVGFGIVAYFAIGIDGAIRGVSVWEATWPHGFIGSVSTDGTTYDWGPLDGWWAFLIASVVQTFGVVIRSIVVLRDE
jgi:hypothetical protein